MLTIKFVRMKASVINDTIIEAMTCHVVRKYVKTYKDWEKEAQGDAKRIINPPSENEERIPFYEISIQNPEGDWINYLAQNVNIYVMNEQGQTIATYYH